MQPCYRFVIATPQSFNGDEDRVVLRVPKNAEIYWLTDQNPDSHLQKVLSNNQ